MPETIQRMGWTARRVQDLKTFVSFYCNVLSVDPTNRYQERGVMLTHGEMTWGNAATTRLCPVRTALSLILERRLPAIELVDFEASRRKP